MLARAVLADDGSGAASDSYSDVCGSRRPARVRRRYGGETIACTGDVDHGQGAVTQGQVGDVVTVGQRQGAFAVAGHRYEALRGAQYPVFVPMFLRRIAEDGPQRRW